MLAKALGVNQLLVVVNKLDATDPPWSEERYEAVKAEVAPFLARTGFRPKKVRFLLLCGQLRLRCGAVRCVAVRCGAARCGAVRRGVVTTVRSNRWVFERVKCSFYKHATLQHSSISAQPAPMSIQQRPRVAVCLPAIVRVARAVDLILSPGRPPGAATTGAPRGRLFLSVLDRICSCFLFSSDRGHEGMNNRLHPTKPLCVSPPLLCSDRQ